MRTIVLVLKSSNDFQLRDVQLIVHHINAKWRHGKPRILCLFDKATEHYDLGNFELLPLTNNFPGTWARIQLYSPEMEQYRPFLYVDLDTAVINSLENIFDIIKDESQFIALEDFWDKGKLATGLVWFPADSEMIRRAWKSFKGAAGKRMDAYLRRVITQYVSWQSLTNTIVDFKPKNKQLLQKLPENCDIVCFHGHPRIHEADIPWVKEYINPKPKVTVIIPFKTDRGWLKDAIASVPEWVQCIVSQGEGNWPENFNKVLDQATGDYIRWLHEDDMLTPNCIEDSVRAIEEQDVDFVHGNAIEIFMNAGRATKRYVPSIKEPVLQDLLGKNVIHSATLMYRKQVFDRVGRLDETLNTQEEYEFNLRCLKAGMKIGYCAEPLAFYRRHPQQKVRVVPIEEKREEKERVKKMFV